MAWYVVVELHGRLFRLAAGPTAVLHCSHNCGTIISHYTHPCVCLADVPVGECKMSRYDGTLHFCTMCGIYM